MDNDLDRDQPCPLCGQTKHMGRRAKKLYNGWVCRKCRNSFVSRRHFAYVIDALIIYAGTWVVTTVLMVASTRLSPGGGNAVAMIVLMMNICLMGAYLFRDAFNGRGPGKALCGVETLDTMTYDRCSVGASIKRNWPLLVPYLAIILAFVLYKGNRWGDGWAKTRVVWTKHKHNWPFDERGILCRKCGYNLTGNVSGICPECGTPIPSRLTERADVSPISPSSTMPPSS